MPILILTRLIKVDEPGKNMTRECVHCGSSRNIEEEHVQARCRGGVTTKPVCRKCNRIKRDKI
jgi:hypothetical protein